MNKSEAGKLGALKSKETIAKKKAIRVEEYYKNPTKCKHCEKVLPYEKKNSKFCSSHCSATYNNAHRKRVKKTFKCLYCGKEHPLRKSSFNKFCNNKCQAAYVRERNIQEWKSGNHSGLSGEYNLAPFIRWYLLEKANHKCSRCGWGEINPYTNKCSLEVHHKDGNYLNNTEDNLEVLCPNCHSLTKTYKNAGKHEGRKGRKKYS